ncbi:MAG TPA: AAA family ATPase [Bacilli bacterium]|nr:AAA family ATPase [Bacilli bacterium]
MNVRWTLNVEGFGKIDKASIRISPLMVFTGDNNSGKSYLMSLLWGILTMEDYLPSPFSFDSPTHTELRKWLLSKSDCNEFEIDAEIIQLFFSHFSESLQASKDVLVQHVFNASIPISRISITDPEISVPITVRLTDSEGIVGEVTKGETIVYQIPRHLLQENTTDDIEEALYIIYSDLILGNLAFLPEKVFYFPASRTGFMLTYKALAKKAVRYGFRTSTSSRSSDMGNLTSPVSKFLSDLVGLSLIDSNRLGPIADFLEKKILQGKIEKDQAPVPSYTFKPAGLDQSLSLHLTSSLVAELTPIVSFLKSTYDIEVMIIEEPEAHLHLDMQRQMARAIVRLVNAGVPVWITTHSDTLVQQINNLIQLEQNSQRQALAEQFEYEEADFLSPDKVTAYQFNAGPVHTEIQQLPLTANGFALPTFTETIRDLSKETLAFMETETDEEDD